MLRALQELLRPLRTRLANLIVRGIVKGIDDSTKMQVLKLALLADEDREGLERFQNYGFTSHPAPEAEAVVVFPGGSRDHGIAIVVDDRRYRLKNLAQGEVAMFDDLGSKIVFKRGGNIEATAPTKILATAPIVEVVASTKVKLNTPLVEITENVTIAGTLEVTGNATLLAALQVNGAASVDGLLTVDDDLVVTGGIDVTGNIQADGGLTALTVSTTGGVGLGSHTHSTVIAGGTCTAGGASGGTYPSGGPTG